MLPTTGLPFFLKKKSSQVYASQNANKLTETQNGNAKIKNQ